MENSLLPPSLHLFAFLEMVMFPFSCPLKIQELLLVPSVSVAHPSQFWYLFSRLPLFLQQSVMPAMECGDARWCLLSDQERQHLYRSFHCTPPCFVISLDFSDKKLWPLKATRLGLGGRSSQFHLAVCKVGRVRMGVLWHLSRGAATVSIRLSLREI